MHHIGNQTVEMPLFGGERSPALNAEWCFVENLYGSPGVSTACLWMQDRLGVDVIVLLHSAWLLCREDRLVDSKTISALDSTISSWRLQIVLPLRSLRRLLKCAAFSISENEVRHTRQPIAQAEIGAERVALEKLAQTSKEITIPVANGALSSELLSRIVNFYFLNSSFATISENNEMRHALETLQLSIDQLREVKN